jgi:hypothetical protein
MPVLGQLWYQVVASHNAILTTDVLNAAPNSGVTVSVFQQNPDTTLKTLASGQQRLDYTATAGQVYYVEVSGVTGATEVRFTNLVALAGNGATVFDTAGNDTFQFTPPSSLTKNYTLVIDGESYQFPFSSSSQVSVTFAGTAGRDVAQLSGSAANDTFVLNLATHSGALTSAAYRVSVSGTDEIDVQGGGGADTATLTGTASADKLTLAPGSATLVSGANQVQATGATSIVVNTGGGGDTAVYTGFSASETVTLRPNTLDVIAGGMTLHASGLATISATAGAGGAQTAILYGSPGNDTFSSTPVSATLSGSGYSNTVNAFPSVTAIGDGGSDTANLADAPGATVAFNGSPTTDSLAGTLASGAAFSETLSGFASVVAKANPGLGIHDQANFTDSGQNVQLVAAGNTAQLSNAAHSFVCQAIGFNFVVATASPTSLDTKHVTPPLGFVLTTVGPWVSI